MELIQIFWDDQNNLFLDLNKDQKERQLFLPETIKRVTIQFEISKFLNQKSHLKEPPYLIAIKKLYHSTESLSFSFELDELTNFDELQIKILRISIYLFSSQRFEYYFKESFKMSDIGVNEDCYLGLEYENLELTKSVKRTVSQKKIFQDIETIIHESIEKQTFIYEKSNFESPSKDDSLVSLISESNKTLKRIEQELKNLSSSIHHLPSNNLQYFPPNPVRRTTESGIERIRVPSKPVLIQGQISSSKLMVIKEMKSIFKSNVENNSDFNIKDILKPLSEEELESMMLDDEVLAERETIAIKNQIERLKKNDEYKIQIENLKPPN